MITIPPQMESKRSMYAFALTNAAIIREWVANGAVAPKGESPYKVTRFSARPKRRNKTYLPIVPVQPNVPQSGGGGALT